MKKRLTILWVMILALIIVSPIVSYAYTHKISLDLDYAKGQIEEYLKKSSHFQVGTILGRQIAQRIGGEAALPLFDQLTTQTSQFLKGLPLISVNLCQGIAAGIIAEVNSQLGLLRAELLIDFKPIKKTRD